ncbi:MAG: hypothetical protein Q9180_008852, partial [Flavoplaca navasiana]
YGGVPCTPVRRRGGRRVSLGEGSESGGEDDGDRFRDTSAEQNTVRRKLFEVQDTPGEKRITANNGLLTPPSTAKKNNRNQQTKSQTQTPIPSIAFRAFNPRSQGLNSSQGFKAGLFINTVCIPPTTSEEIYLSELKRHLEKYHSGPTPFISVSPYLMRVIMHACRKDRELREGEKGEKGEKRRERENGEWSVAVIALRKVKGDVRAVRGLQAGWNAVRAWGEWVGELYYPSGCGLIGGSSEKMVLLTTMVDQYTAKSPPKTSFASYPFPIWLRSCRPPLRHSISTNSQRPRILKERERLWRLLSVVEA